MGNIVLATPALSDAGTITAGAEESANPATNLLTLQPGEVWQTPALASIFVELDLGSAQTINLVALLGHNGTDAATWRVRSATSQANLTASPTRDTGNVSMFPITRPSDWTVLHSIDWNSTGESARWWRVDMIDAANPDSKFRAGRLYVANAWQPTVNIVEGWSLGWLDPSPRQLAIGGQMYPLTRNPRRVVNFALRFQTEDQIYNNAFETDRLRGSSKDILVVRDPDATTHLHRQTVYGLISDLRPIVNPNVGLFEKLYRVQELLA